MSIFSEKTVLGEGRIPAAVLAEQCQKLVILSENELMVHLADDIAQLEPIGARRMVVWIKNAELAGIQDQIPELKKTKDCIAFSLSPTNKIGSVISNNTVIDYVELDSAFLMAGRSKNG